MKLKRCRLTEKQQDRLVEFFVGEMTARTAADLVGVNKTTAAYFFHRPRIGSLPLAGGGFLTGLFSVVIGEVVIPLLVKRYKVPVPAAATSILVVIVTVMTASFTHIPALIAEGGVSAAPWNLVCYTVPAVIIGGQVGPRLQGRISSRIMERVIGSLFLAIGAAFMWIVFRPA